jgi:DNA repair protein SbcC/Rad50
VVADLVSRVSEVAGGTAPDGWAGDPEGLRAWMGEVTTSAVNASVAQTLLVDAASAAEVAASEESAAGIELAGRRATYAAARRARAGLDAARAEHDTRVDRVAQAQRAAGVRPLHELAVSARAEVRELDQLSRAARDRLAEMVGATSLDDQEIAEHQRSATSTLTEIARVRPFRRQASDLERQRGRLTRARNEAGAELVRVQTRSEEIPQVLAALEPRLQAARESRTLAEALTADLEVLRSRTRAARTAESLTIQLRAAEQALSEATQARLLARESLVEIREQRLDGMAAEIAGKLAVGADCPVCGSTDHPHPAKAAPGAPDEATEREARREVDDLEVVVEAHAQQVRGLETQRAAALAESGHSVEHLLVEEEAALANLERARTEASTVEAWVVRVETLTSERDALAREQAELTATTTRLDTEIAVLTTKIDALLEQVGALVPDDADLDDLTAHHQGVEQLARDCLAQTAELGRARATAASTQEAADGVAAAAGFDSSAWAAAAWLTDAELADLQQQIERHEREAARVDDLLSDESLVLSAASDPPDLEALAQAHHRAKEHAAQARQTDMRLRDRGRRLRGLSDEMDAALSAWAPVRADFDLTADLAALVEGKHADNRYQMRLSAYVLAHRLSQVVDAANVRLATMSGQRYSLVHTGQRGAGETRGGLSLLVRDDWTGDSRDPATLSGGETFVVSLALALGLADVITDEAGGTDLDTLFVDEGFGSLDSETLEDVMDTLDTLRDGGRVVGVVSHVPELQTRIPTQLRVHRGRNGSHTSLSLG